MELFWDWQEEGCDVVDDSGVPFCKASYIAEGEPPLILTTDNIFSNLEKHIDNGYGKNI